jgi:hypothetical protein
MKSTNNSKITPHKTGKEDKVVIDAEQYTGPEVVEYICSHCNCNTLVKLSDAAGNNQELFCTRCSSMFSLDDDTVRHKQRISVPLETEPAISTTPGIPDISIRKEPELRGGFAQLAKKGTIRFTDYHTTEKE